MQRFQPALVCIEAHPEVRQQILDYFAQRNYVVIGKYLRADPQNLYFRPLASELGSLRLREESLSDVGLTGSQVLCS